MEFITRQQQEYAHALMRDISRHSGYLSDALGYEAIKNRFKEAIDDDFSLALNKCTRDMFDMFMDYLKDIALDYGVVTKHPMVPWQDLEKWSLYCLKTNKCCVTGQNNGIMCWIDKPSYNSYELPNIKKYRRISLNEEIAKELQSLGYDQFIKLYPTATAIRCKLEGEE